MSENKILKIAFLIPNIGKLVEKLKEQIKDKEKKIRNLTTEYLFFDSTGFYWESFLNVEYDAIVAHNLLPGDSFGGSNQGSDMEYLLRKVVEKFKSTKIFVLGTSYSATPLVIRNIPGAKEIYSYTDDLIFKSLAAT